MNSFVRLKKYIFFILFTSFTVVAFSQNSKNFDKLYTKTSSLVDEENFKLAFDQALNLENLGNQNNDNLQIAKSNYLLATIFKKQENYLQTIKYATKALQFATTENNLEYQILSNELLAWAYIYIGFFDEADKILKDTDTLLSSYSGPEKHYLTYKKLYREASLMRRRKEKPKSILQVYFVALKEINSYNFTNPHHKNENYLSLYNNIGRIYKKINKDSAFAYYDKATKYKDNYDKRGVADLDTNIASYYVSKNENTKAIDLLNSSIPTLIKSDHKFLTAQSFKILSEAYKNEGNNEKSIENNTLYLTYKDSLNLKRMQSVNEAVDYVKKLNNEEKIEKEEIPTNYLAIGIIFVIGLAGYFVFKKKKTV